jgi:hypothetical protein
MLEFRLKIPKPSGTGRLSKPDFKHQRIRKHCNSRNESIEPEICIPNRNSTKDYSKTIFVINFADIC